MDIGREKFDELGNKIRDWLDEQGFETNAEQDLELQHLVLGCLGVRVNFSTGSEVKHG